MSKEPGHPEKNLFSKIVSLTIVAFFVFAMLFWALDAETRRQIMSKLRGDTNIVTVDGDNIVSPAGLKRVLERRRINFRSYPDPLIPQFVRKIQGIQSAINRKVLLKYANDIGFILSDKTTLKLARELYFKDKRRFEIKYNQRFQEPFETYYAQARDGYLISLAASTLTEGILITDIEAALKFQLENTRRQVEFVSYDFSNFLEKVQFTTKELKEYFNSREASSFRTNVRNKVRAYAIKGYDKVKMLKLLKSVKANPGLFEKEMKKQNETARDYILTPELVALRVAKVGRYSRLITRTVAGRKAYYIFKIIKHYSKGFNELNAGEMLKLKRAFIKSPKARNKYLEKYKKQVKKLLKEVKQAVKRGGNMRTEAQKRGFKFGTTEFFPVIVKDTVDNTIHDPIQNLQRKPITIFGAKNKTFFETVFKLKLNETSNVLNSGFTYYIVKLVNVKNAPAFDALNKKKYFQSIKKRQSMEFQSRLLRYLYKKYKVRWYDANIIKYVRAIYGRNS